jgi:hypothetical protein
MQDYSTEGLTQTQKSLMQQLRQFGLIYQRKVHFLWLHVELLYLQALILAKPLKSVPTSSASQLCVQYASCCKHVQPLYFSG